MYKPNNNDSAMDIIAQVIEEMKSVQKDSFSYDTKIWQNLKDLRVYWYSYD